MAEAPVDEAAAAPAAAQRPPAAPKPPPAPAAPKEEQSNVEPAVGAAPPGPAPVTPRQPSPSAQQTTPPPAAASGAVAATPATPAAATPATPATATPGTPADVSPQPSPRVKPPTSDGPDVSFLRSYLERVRPATRGISDDELRALAYTVQEEAIEQDFVMRFILDMTFLRPRIDAHFAYKDLLSRLGAERDRRLVDVGCGLGTDLRALVMGGVAEQQLFGVDRHAALIDLGYLLFRDKGRSYVTYYAEDFLRVNVPSSISLDHPRGLEDLFGRVHAATAVSVLHLLDEYDVQSFLARAFALLQPGGILLGRNLASDRPGVFTALARPACFSCSLLCARGPLTALAGCWSLTTRCATCTDRGDSRIRYLHSPESLTAALQAAGFVNVRVEIHSAAPTDSDSLRSVPEGTPPPARRSLRFVVAWAAEKPTRP
eukprot:tig00001001_g6199.t1